jgi:MFS family permease
MPDRTASRPAGGDWIVVLSCLVCQIGMGVGGYLFPVFLKPVADDLGWSRTTYAAAHPIMTTAVALAGPLVGWLAERRGPRLVLAAGALLMGGSVYAAGAMRTSLEFYAIAVGVGVAVACLGDLPTGAAIASRFRDRRGVALSLVYIGSNVGGAIGVLAGARLAAAGSWRDAFAAIAVGLWVVVLPSAFGVPASASDGDETGVGARAQERSGAARETSRVAAGVGAGVGEAAVVDPAAALRTRDFWLLAWALFAFYFYRLGVNTHLVALLSDLGYAQGEAALGFGATLAVGVAGKLCAGALADRVGVRPAVVGNFAILLAASLLLLIARAPLAVPAFLLLHGVATAAEDVVVPLLVVRRFGALHLARLYGLLLLALVPGGYVGPIAAGRVFDATQSYDGVFGVFVAGNATALAAVWLVASARSRG